MNDAADNAWGVVILHEDPHCLVVSKPAEMYTQGTEDSLDAWLRAYLSPHGAGADQVWTVHRLDRPVSGLLVFARNVRAARRLSGHFEHRRVSKEYWALVEGTPETSTGLWVDHVAKIKGSPRRLLDAGLPGAQEARTRFETVPAARPLAGAAWLKLFPETGRTHQLRVQTSGHGVPILGDATYGSTREFPRGIALHAAALTFRHPATDLWVTFRAEVPPAWAEAGFLAAENG